MFFIKTLTEQNPKYWLITDILIAMCILIDYNAIYGNNNALYVVFLFIFDYFFKINFTIF